MADFLSTIGLSANAQNKLAAKSAQFTETGAKKTATKGTKLTKKGYAQAQEALAPAITAAGDYLTKQNQGYDVYRGALGLTGQEGADTALRDYQLSLQPGTALGEQSILRNNAAAGGLRSGATSTDLNDYIFNTQYNPWRESLKLFDPLAATQQVGQFGALQGERDIGQGTALSNIYANKFNTIYGAKAGVPLQQASNIGAVGQNYVGLAGALLGAGTKLAGMYAGKPPV